MNKEIKNTKKRRRLNEVINNFPSDFTIEKLSSAKTTIAPNSKIEVTVKYNGTGIVIGNFPKADNKFIKFIRKLFPFIKPTYKVLGTSRSYVKFKGEDDILASYVNLLKPYLNPNTIIYGEIVGYTKFGKAIQDGYDYKCLPNTSKLIIYRINIDGKEFNIQDIIKYVRSLRNTFPSLRGKVEYPELLYSGEAMPVCNGYENLYYGFKSYYDQFLISCREKFKIEKYEPLCNNQVWREGIVVRIKNDVLPRAFILKGNNFLSQK